VTREHPPGPPMDLANMRERGVHSRDRWFNELGEGSPSAPCMRSFAPFEGRLWLLF